jgi:hypothetical protein
MLEVMGYKGDVGPVLGIGGRLAAKGTLCYLKEIEPGSFGRERKRLIQKRHKDGRGVGESDNLRAGALGRQAEFHAERG